MFSTTSSPKSASSVIRWEKVPGILRLTQCVGAFGNVKIGWLKKSPNDKFAIKTMKKNDIIQSKHVDHIENEKNILECLDHPFSVSSDARQSHQL